jgi:dTDP-4-amino-4,6-dideoxygalactose transaminase
MKPIPLVDLNAQYQSIAPEIDAAIQRIVRSQRFIGGAEVSGFEAEWARFSGVAHAIGVANGTDAIEVVLRALDLEPGFEVVTVANTFVATAEAIIAAGGVPVFCDVDPQTLLLDPEQIERCVTPRTRVIMPVHLYGAPADMVRIAEIAGRLGLVVVEDAAQAHGARYGGEPVGTRALAATFSFFPGKNLGAYGDAGAIVTNDADFARKLMLLRDHGRSGKYVHETVGRNSRLDALQAAILGAKLSHLKSWNARRRAVYERYVAAFQGCDDILPVPVPAYGESAYHLMVVRVPAALRDRCIDYLKERGIEAGVHYPIPLHRQPGYEDMYRDGTHLPVTEQATAEILSLPMYPELPETSVQDVAKTLIDAIESLERAPTRAQHQVAGTL